MPHDDFDRTERCLIRMIRADVVRCILEELGTKTFSGWIDSAQSSRIATAASRAVRDAMELELGLDPDERPILDRRLER